MIPRRLEYFREYPKWANDYKISRATMHKIESFSHKWPTPRIGIYISCHDIHDRVEDAKAEMLLHLVLGSVAQLQLEVLR